MYQFKINYIANHRLRTMTLAFQANNETDARKACEQFLKDNKYQHWVIKGEGTKI